MMLQLVNNGGQTIGHIEKMAAHKEGGVLHRAVSVLLFDGSGNILIQQRSASKYHFAGKWANASCTHPHHDETPLEAGNRALREELGVEAQLKEVAPFIYEAHDDDSGYTELEYDHILVGNSNQTLTPNPSEVSDFKWLNATALENLLRTCPDDFAFWFKEILRIVPTLPRDTLAKSAELEAFVDQLTH